MNQYITWENNQNISSQHVKKHRVIAGSFSKFQNALTLKQDLQIQLLDPIILFIKRNGKTIYRVQTHSYNNKDKAKTELNKLKEEGLKVIL